MQRVYSFLSLCNFFICCMSTPIENGSLNKDISSGNIHHESISYHCKPLHECKHYHNLFGDMMSESISDNALKFFQRIKCDEDLEESGVYKVKCPVEKSKPYDLTENKILGILGNKPTGQKNFLINHSRNSDKKCYGMLIITHEDDDENSGEISLNTEFRKQYSHLQKGFRILRRNSIASLATTGDCCWEIHSKPHFKGDKELIYPGEDNQYPSIQPASARTTKCFK